MSNQLYIRARGRVLGPYDQEKLQALARSGQLSRMHEVSTDGLTWSRASKFPELFAPAANDAPRLESEAEPAAPAAPAPQPAPKQGWHYTSKGVESGPTEFSKLQLLVATGQITADDVVWTDGMTNWVPARQVPGLVVENHAATPTAASVPQPTMTTDELPATLCRAALTSRPWVLFIAIVLYVYAILSAVAGLLFLMAGSNARTAPLVASGIFGFIYAIIAICAGTLLVTYSSRMGRLTYSANPHSLERALDALRSFWVFVSIVLIVMLAFGGVVLVWAIAVGATVPGVNL